MEPTTIVNTACVLMALAGAGGALMAWMRFAGRPHPPDSLAMLHGFLAAAGLTLLIYGAATVGLPPLALASIMFFLIAGVGGVTLNLKFHLQEKALPKWLIVVHAIAAFLGFLLLLIASYDALASSKMLN